MKSNFGKTVLAGLSGLALVSIVEPLLKGKDQGDLRLFYVVWFAAWFVLLMLVYMLVCAFFKGFTEAWRSRLASDPPLPPWPAGDAVGSGVRASYWWRRSWSYLLSWRPTILTFLDTSISFFFGRNLLRNAVLGDEIVELQSSLYRATDRLRQHVADAVRDALREAGVGDVRPDSVRVNVSMLSRDRSFLWYIAWAPGSLIRTFSRNSVAWVAVCSGEARWWKESYKERADRIVLFKNERRELDVPAKVLYLKNYFEPRDPHDYRAFVVLPLPSKTRRRGLGERYRTRAVHISFGVEEYLEKIWPMLSSEEIQEAALSDPYSDRWNQVASDPGPSNPELRAVLRQAMDTLVELLRDFNPTIFEMHIRPRLIS